jgi:hypothetical protein
MLCVLQVCHCAFCRKPLRFSQLAVSGLNMSTYLFMEYVGNTVVMLAAVEVCTLFLHAVHVMKMSESTKHESAVWN